VTTAYDGHGQLTGYTRTGELSLTMVYNGLDERVMLTPGGGATGRSTQAPDGRFRTLAWS
jgi:YD repeat-containing protein